MTSDLMNTEEAAKYLGINEKKLYSLANAKKIPSTRVTGKWIFPQTSLTVGLKKARRAIWASRGARSRARQSCWRREVMIRR